MENQEGQDGPNCCERRLGLSSWAFSWASHVHFEGKRALDWHVLSQCSWLPSFHMSMDCWNAFVFLLWFFGDHENIVCVCNLSHKMQCCSLVSKTGCSVAAVPNVLWKDFELICYQNMCVASQLEFWKQQWMLSDTTSCPHFDHLETSGNQWLALCSRAHSFPSGRLAHCCHGV